MASKKIYLEAEVHRLIEKYAHDNELTESKAINNILRKHFKGVGSFVNIEKLEQKANKVLNEVIIPAKPKENSKPKETVKQPEKSKWNLKQPKKGLTMKEQINRQRSRNSA